MGDTPKRQKLGFSSSDLGQSDRFLGHSESDEIGQGATEVSG